MPAKKRGSHEDTRSRKGRLMSSGSIQRLLAGSGQGCSWGPLPPGPPRQGTLDLPQALFIRQLIRPQESHSGALSSVPPPCQGMSPQAWPRWAWAHLVMSELGPCRPDHRPVVLGGQLLHLLHGPVWRALGAQGRRAPGRDREGTAEAQPLGLPHPARR